MIEFLLGLLVGFVICNSGWYFLETFKINREIKQLRSTKR